jgi:hypothetical protein
MDPIDHQPGIRAGRRILEPAPRGLNVCCTSRIDRAPACVNGRMSIAIAAAGGTWAFGTFVVLFFLAISHGYYSRSGSAINQRPHNGGGDAPGAKIPSTIGRDVARRDYTHGTR